MTKPKLTSLQTKLRILQEAANAYGEPLFDGMLSIKRGRCRLSDSAENCGDTLALFILRELGDCVDADKTYAEQLGQATKAITNGIEDLQRVLDRLKALAAADTAE